jgi:hypothetical protein
VTAAVLLAGVLVAGPVAISVAGVLAVRGAELVADRAIAWAERRWRR